ncbi:MAG: ATPase [Bacteroidia bacterium]
MRNLDAMKILIADSGSTKTAWRFLAEDGTQLRFETEGFNPYHREEAELKTSMETALRNEMSGHVPDQIFFYGSGCGNPEKCGIIERSLRNVFPDAAAEVHSDMLGAARGLCGHQPGIAAILGTGSNSCVYDGKNVVTNRPSLGYIMGDEGSGADIGKRLLRLYLYHEMDDGLLKNFESRFGSQHAEIIHSIYRKPFPNRYIASYARFVFQNIQHRQCIEIVCESFNAFLEKHILHYPESNIYPIHFTGSIAFYFSNLLRRVLEEKGLRAGRITENPMAGLVNYHLGISEE